MGWIWTIDTENTSSDMLIPEEEDLIIRYLQRRRERVILRILEIIEKNSDSRKERGMQFIEKYELNRTNQGAFNQSVRRISMSSKRRQFYDDLLKTFTWEESVDILSLGQQREMLQKALSGNARQYERTGEFLDKIYSSEQEIDIPHRLIHAQLTGFLGLLGVDYEELFYE